MASSSDHMASGFVLNMILNADAAQLREIVLYDPNTGIFTWLKPLSNAVKIGEQVTSKNYGYIRLGLAGKRYFAHRLAWFYMTGEWPTNQIDHINGIKDDNRWCNLRLANNSQNNFNRGIRKTNSSGYRYVYWDSSHGKYRADITINGKRTFIGLSNDPKELSDKVEEVAKVVHGEFYFKRKEVPNDL